MGDDRRRGVLVTGASQGIGAAIALDLHAQGFQVFAGVRRAADGGSLAAQAPGLVPVALDVTDAAQVAQAAAFVGAAVGDNGLYGLVNNAGVAVVGPLEFLPLEELRRQFEVNVFAQLVVTQAFLPLLRQGGGRIINMGSINGRFPLPLFGPYAASKRALAALTDALRLELAAWRIPVTLIEPGNVATAILDRTLASAHRLRPQLPPRAEELYGPAMDTVEAAARHMANDAAPTDAVVEVVRNALLLRRPKGRYVVGKDAKLVALAAALVPQRIRDWVLRRYLRLKDHARPRPAPQAGGPGVR
jgi:NAD(P)-dependent dehydrogenase (short-subunit alcohol dehydrogenase family)